MKYKQFVVTLLLWRNCDRVCVCVCQERGTVTPRWQWRPWRRAPCPPSRFWRKLRSWRICVMINWCSSTPSSQRSPSTLSPSTWAKVRGRIRGDCMDHCLVRWSSGLNLYLVNGVLNVYRKSAGVREGRRRSRSEATLPRGYGRSGIPACTAPETDWLIYLHIYSLNNDLII